MNRFLSAGFLLSLATPLLAQSSVSSPSPISTPATVTALVRERTNATQWFAATPDAELYGHQDSLIRLGISQRIRHFDYMLEIGQSAELALPTDAVSPITAQGQLGLGGTYFASNNNNYPAAASLRQGFLRYHSTRDKVALRLGRFEFFEGQETAPKNNTLLWLQTNRIGQRLVGNFGFTNGQRSFDGVDAKVGGGTDWDITAMAGRATQGVFNMNANPELNVDVQYLAYTRTFASGHVLVRGFGLGYHDGRTGLTKTDDRTAAARALDHKNIRIGTYGGDLIASVPMGKTTTDLLVWGAGQTGSWGTLNHSAGAVAVEAGIRFDGLATKPWIRGGYLRTTGDDNSLDNTHNTFFQVLPTPRVYARYPFFDMMNSKDEFVQLIDKPSAKLDLRSDLHFLQLTAPSDLWYQGGGAFDNKVFGYTGRPGANGGSFSSLYDLSADYALTKQLSLAMYYAHAFGKTVIGVIYPTERDSNYGFFELNYRLQKKL